MKKEFNPLEWIESKTIPQANQQNISTGFRNESCTEFEKIITEIEMNQTDIAPSYAEWRDIGFALAEEFQEAGRDYFHRVSQFNSSYNQKECDEQFSSCLKAKGNGISIKTFY